MRHAAPRRAAAIALLGAMVGLAGCGTLDAPASSVPPPNSPESDNSLGPPPAPDGFMPRPSGVGQDPFSPRQGATGPGHFYGDN